MKNDDAHHGTARRKKSNADNYLAFLGRGQLGTIECYVGVLPVDRGRFSHCSHGPIVCETLPHVLK